MIPEFQIIKCPENDVKSKIGTIFVNEKILKALEKTLNCKFIRINTSRGNYDVDYEASRIQVFISQFKETK